MRVFLAHRKGEGETTSMLERLRELFRREYPCEGVEVTSGAQHFEEHALNLGGFQGWIHEVHSGMEDDGDVTHLGRPLFDICVVPDRTIGRATFDIIHGFLANRKPVVYWDRGSAAAKVIDATKIESEKPSWADYAIVVLAGVGE